jgi:peroxiredoxin
MFFRSKYSCIRRRQLVKVNTAYVVNAYGAVEAQLHEFLTLVLDGDTRFASCLQYAIDK